MIQKILFIGCGNMGKALLKKIIASGVKKENIIIIIKSEKSKNNLINQGFVVLGDQDLRAENFSTNNLISDCNMVIYAAKPQIAGEILGFYQEKNLIKSQKSQIILSIAAGLKIKFFEKFSPQAEIIRSSPMLSVQFGAGMTILFGNQIEDNQKREIEKLFAKSGKIIWVENESEVSMNLGKLGLLIYCTKILAQIAKNCGVADVEAEKIAVVAIEKLQNKNIGNIENKMPIKDSFSATILDYATGKEVEIEDIIESCAEQIFSSIKNVWINHHRQYGKMLYEETLAGAVILAKNKLTGGENLAQILAQITSPNGTTAAGNYALEHPKVKILKFEDFIEQSIMAIENKTKQLEFGGANYSAIRLENNRAIHSRL